MVQRTHSQPVDPRQTKKRTTYPATDVATEVATVVRSFTVVVDLVKGRHDALIDEIHVLRGHGLRVDASDEDARVDGGARNRRRRGAETKVVVLLLGGGEVDETDEGKGSKLHGCWFDWFVGLLVLWPVAKSRESKIVSLLGRPQNGRRSRAANA